MNNQRSKNIVFKAKETSCLRKRSNERKESLKLEVKTCKKCSRKRWGSHPLLKYVLISSGFVVLIVWLGFAKVDFINYPTFRLETSDTLSRVSRHPEVTHQLKKELASTDVEQKRTRSETECVINGKRLAEVETSTDTEVITAKKKVQRVVKMSELESTVIMVKKMKTFVGKDKNPIAVLNRTTRERNYTNLKRKACFTLENETQKEKLNSQNIEKFPQKTNKIPDENPFLDKAKNKIMVEKVKNKSLSEGNNLECPSERNAFSKVSPVSKPIIEANLQQLVPNRDDGNVLKNRKVNNAKLSFVTPAGGNDQITIETKKNKIEPNRLSDYLSSEMKNFQSTIQSMFLPKQILVNGRQISPIELIPHQSKNSSVRIFIFEGFLSNDECDNLRKVHNKHIKLMSNDDPLLCFDSVKTLRLHLKSAGRDHIKVSHLDFTKDTTCVNKTFSSQLKKWLKAKWSYSTAFYSGENKFSKLYEQRVKRATGLNPENGGKFQIISYPNGIGYKKHTDCIENSSEKRDRMATILVYLETVKGGGETRFPELGISVKPRKGRALLWNNMAADGNCDPMSAHIAESVTNGHKYILQRWYYLQNFYSLGKRPHPQKEKPKRNFDQARVSCDEFAHGSCRWYDEWNHDHFNKRMLAKHRKTHQQI